MYGLRAHVVGRKYVAVAVPIEKGKRESHRINSCLMALHRGSSTP